MAVHAHARSFGPAAELYEQGRPDFPAASLAFLTRSLDLQPGRRVLDLAAGTGKLTRALVRTGADVVAVEPVAGMRAVFASLLPQVPILDGTAEAIPLPDDDVDAVTVAQAFHWFDPEPALAEMNRVLRSGGRVALMWNSRDETSPVEQAATAVIERHRDGTPSHRTMDLANILATSPFEPVDRHHLAWTMQVNEPAFLARFLSVSFVAALDQPIRDQVAEELRDVFVAHAVDGLVRHAYTCQAHILASGA